MKCNYCDGDTEVVNTQSGGRQYAKGRYKRGAICSHDKIHPNEVLRTRKCKKCCLSFRTREMPLDDDPANKLNQLTPVFDKFFDDVSRLLRGNHG